MKVRSLAKAFLREMALDLGNVPPFDPEKKRKIERGEHPYAQNPAFPREPGAGSYPPGEHPGAGRVRNYAELIASDHYHKLVQKLAQVLGVPVQQVGPRSIMPLMTEFMQAAQRAQRYEAAHREQLQDLAIETLFRFPEFAPYRQAYENDDIRIKAVLVEQVSTEGTNVAPPPPDEQEQAELQVAQIAQELDVEKNKRRFINMLIQGAAVNKNHAYEVVRDALNHIDPRLFDLYAILMSVSEWLYWVIPDQHLDAMSGGEGEGKAAGRATFYIDEDGTPVIDAQALNFPVLIQELVKGFMEYMSWFAQKDEGTDPETFHRVARETDTLHNEIWDIMFGPGVWRQIMRMIGEENHDLLRYIYTDIAAKPPNEFNRLQQHLLRGDREGQEYLQNLIRQLREEERGGEEPPAQEPPPAGPAPGGAPAGGGDEGEDPADYWKKESVDKYLDGQIRRVTG